MAAKMKRKAIRGLLIAALVALAAIAAVYLRPSQSPSFELNKLLFIGMPEEAPVVVAEPEKLVAVELVKVTDGDTIRVMLDGEKTAVRLIGIDTPEEWKKRGGKWIKDPDPYSLEAAAFTEQFLKGRDIWLEYDVERFDRYGRTLAYVWAQGPDETAKELANITIIRSGLAELLTIPPNVKYVDRLKSALQAAKREKLKLWAGTE